MGIFGLGLRLVAGKQAKAGASAVATGLAAKLARDVASRVTASRGAESTMARAAAALARGAEKTHRVSHGIYQLQAAETGGGLLKTHLIDGLVSAGLEYVGPQAAPQQTFGSPPGWVTPAILGPQECHQPAQRTEQAGDLPGAFRLYGAAAMRGYPPAMNDLAYCYETGIGVQQDKALAMSWYRAAAARGHANTAHNLALLEAEERRAAEAERAQAAPQRGTLEWARMKLGVAPEASEREIKAAHLRLIGLLHPDRGGFNTDAADLNDARRVLLGRHADGKVTAQQMYP